MNTQQIYQLICNTNLDNTVTQINNYLFVNLDWLTNRNYQFEGTNEFLYYIGQHKDKQIVFLQRDGVNLQFTGIQEIIKQTIKDTGNPCYLYGYNNPKIDNCMFLPLDAIQMWIAQCYPLIKDLPLSTLSNSYKFAGLFGRFDMFRLKLYRHLKQYDSLLGWNSAQVSYNARHYENYKDDLTWFNSTERSIVDYPAASGSVSFRDALKDIGKHYTTYFIEVVSETDVHNDKFFTEKTLKNFYLGKPFLLLSGANSLAQLRSYGFQTFAPYINESYDTLSSVYDRVSAIKKEIDRLAALDYTSIVNINKNLQPIFEHNRSIFEYLAMGKK